MAHVKTELLKRLRKATDWLVSEITTAALHHEICKGAFFQPLK